MINNDILRKIRYIFDFDDSEMMSLFSRDGKDATRAEVSNWLKRDDHEDFQALNDEQFAVFLDAFITLKRGEQKGVKREPDKKLNNNMILMKIKIALNLKAEELLDIISVAGFSLSAHELSAFFRKPGHKHYRKCKDQVLRNFLKGLQERHGKVQSPAKAETISKPRPEMVKKEVTEPVKEDPSTASHNIWGSGSSSKRR